MSKMKNVYLLQLIMLIGMIHAKEPCAALLIPPAGNPTMFYACDSNNDLQGGLRLEPNSRAVTVVSYICKNGSWEFTTQPKSNESCLALPAQENTTTFYFCNSNNNVQSTFTSTSNLTYSLIPPKTCVNRVWIITDLPSSNAPPATTSTTPVDQGKSQQESSVTKVEPAIILMAIYLITCFI